MPNPSPILSVAPQDDGRFLATYADLFAAFLATVGVFQLVVPGGPIAHRTAVTAADGTTKPDPVTPAHGTWLVNPGNKQQARVFVDTTGAPTTCTVRPYLRNGGPVSLAKVGTSQIQTVAGVNPGGDLAFDIQCAGDDLLCYVETLAGGTSPSVSIAVSWR